MTEPGGLLPSLPDALAAISGERDRQLQHFEGLDTKAGVLPGFDGVLVALARNVAWSQAGRVVMHIRDVTGP